MNKIAFLGMGLMGSRMAIRLLDAQFAVSVWNRTASACAPLCAAGALQLDDLTDISSFDIIALCLSDDKAVHDVVQMILPSLRPKQVIVDFSSLSVATTLELANTVHAQGVAWIDAPVSGGVMGASAGTLIVFAGGDSVILDQLTAFFAPLAARVNVMGAVGAGQVTKICNQLIVASNSTIIAEAVALATAAGLDANKLAPALAGGFADSKPLQILAPRMASQTFTPVQWKVATLLKDLSNAQVLAQMHGLQLAVATQAQQQLQTHVQQGYAQDDLSSIININRSSHDVT